MNAARIIVRVDAEQNAAELEIQTPHHRPRFEGLEQAVRQLGIRPLHTIHLSESRYQICRMRLVEQDGSKLDESRMAQILRIAQDHRPAHLACFFDAVRSLSPKRLPSSFHSPDDCEPSHHR